MLTHEELLRRANARAQRRWHRMLEERTWAQPSARTTRLVTQAERLVDALVVEMRWQEARVEMDALQLADPEAPDYYALAVQ